MLAQMPIVPGTGLEVVTGGRVADVARVVAVDQKQERRKVIQAKRKSQWLEAAGGRSPSG